MKIRNISDVITNSSNEVFIYRSDADPVKVLGELKKILGLNHGCSGMGGVLEVSSTPELKDFNYREAYLGLPKGYLLINVDQGYFSDLKDWLQSNLGEPISKEEELKLFLPICIEKNSKFLEELKKVTEVTPKTKDIFCEWNISRYDLKVCGGIPEIPKDKVQLFLDYHEKEYQKLKERADKLIPKSESWYCLQYDMDIQSNTIKGLKKIIR